MAKTRNRAVDVTTAQKQAVEFAREWLSANNLWLPADMQEEEFANTMNTVTRGLVQAYAAGYLADR